VAVATKHARHVRKTAWPCPHDYLKHGIKIGGITWRIGKTQTEGKCSIIFRRGRSRRRRFRGKGCSGKTPGAQDRNSERSLSVTHLDTMTGKNKGYVLLLHFLGDIDTKRAFAVILITKTY
jgi:hypothetical protein